MSESERNVQAFMTPSPSVLRRNDVLTKADELMREGNYRHLPVLDEYDKLCGVVSQRDIFRGALLRALGYGERAEGKMLQALKVKEVMTREPASITPERSLADAAAVMAERKVGCLPVLDGEQLVGIITETDLLRAVV